LKINFNEVTIFLCLLAYKLKATLLLDANCKEEEEEAWLKRPHEWVRTLLDKIMPAFNQEVQLDVNEATANLLTNAQPQDILLGGAVQEYRPPTPERFRQSDFGSMFSEMSRSEYGHVNYGLINQIKKKIEARSIGFKEPRIHTPVDENNPFPVDWKRELMRHC